MQLCGKYTQVLHMSMVGVLGMTWGVKFAPIDLASKGGKQFVGRALLTRGPFWHRSSTSLSKNVQVALQVS
jgi:hypothetical protein